MDRQSLSGSRTSPTSLPPLKGPGIYAYYLRNPADLPFIPTGDDGIIYVGMTEQGLDARNHVAHRHSGFSTLRRSLGALLKDKLHLTAFPRSSGKSKSNMRCYRFDEDGERALTSWMEQNLLCSQVEMDEGVAGSEARLIATLQPPLNLKGWSNPHAAHVKALRAKCARQAEGTE